MMRYHLRQIISILLLPGMVTIVIPAVILWQTGKGNIAWGFPSHWNAVLIVSGFILILAGLILMVQTISLFATVGKGTLAPWDATRKLVIKGPYRYVRNPMIGGVFAILLGEAILVGSIPLFGWFLFAVLLNLSYIPLSEEPGLLRRFGKDYTTYKQHVPRWIPRLRPWKEKDEDTEN